MIEQGTANAELSEIEVLQFAKSFGVDRWRQRGDGEWEGNYNLFAAHIDPKTAFSLTGEALALPGLAVNVNAPDMKGFLLIDGHHRLARKYFDGIEVMKVWTISDPNIIKEFYECLDTNKALFLHKY